MRRYSNIESYNNIGIYLLILLLSKIHFESVPFIYLKKYLNIFKKYLKSYNACIKKILEKLSNKSGSKIHKFKIHRF